MPQQNPDSAVENLFNSLATKPTPAQCQKCGSKSQKTASSPCSSRSKMPGQSAHRPALHSSLTMSTRGATSWDSLDYSGPYDLR